jgi:hypothetical protein
MILRAVLGFQKKLSTQFNSVTRLGQAASGSAATMIQAAGNSHEA